MFDSNIGIMTLNSTIFYGALLAILQWATLWLFVRIALKGRRALGVMVGAVHYLTTFGLGTAVIVGLSSRGEYALFTAGYVASTVGLVAIAAAWQWFQASNLSNVTEFG